MIKIKPKLTAVQRAKHLLGLKESAKRRRRIHELLDRQQGNQPKIIQSVAGENSKRDRRRFGETEAIAEARRPRRNK